MNDFKDRYRFDPDSDVQEYVPHAPTTPRFNPDEIAKSISKEQIIGFADLVKGTPNQNLIAYKDPKVQELVDFIMAAIIHENNRINGSDAFPVQIYRRYKADESLENKLKSWSKSEENADRQVPDYLGFKIIPESEPSTLYAGDDNHLQRLIDERERVRGFVAYTYKRLSHIKDLTYDDYYHLVCPILLELENIFPYDAISRKQYYKNIQEALAIECSAYKDLHENPDEPMPLEEILELSDVNIKKLLSELQRANPNEVTLYKLKKDLLRTFENSELLQSLGISISKDPYRTKRKSQPNGYRSEFVGLDLTIDTEEHGTIVLPIECQIQTMEQYKDGNVGLSAHFKMPNKGARKLKSIPGAHKDARYTSPTSALKERKDFLSWIMHISPLCSVARITGHDFETGRTVITPYDLYEAFRLIHRVPKEDKAYRMYSNYLTELYEKRKELFPTGETILPKYITFDEIPNPSVNIRKYNEFFSSLRSSLDGTLTLLDEKDTLDSNNSSQVPKVPGAPTAPEER